MQLKFPFLRSIFSLNINYNKEVARLRSAVEYPNQKKHFLYILFGIQELVPKSRLELSIQCQYNQGSKIKLFVGEPRESYFDRTADF